MGNIHVCVCIRLYQRFVYVEFSILLIMHSIVRVRILANHGLMNQLHVIIMYRLCMYIFIGESIYSHIGLSKYKFPWIHTQTHRATIRNMKRGLYIYIYIYMYLSRGASDKRERESSFRLHTNMTQTGLVSIKECVRCRRWVDTDIRSINIEHMETNLIAGEDMPFSSRRDNPRFRIMLTKKCLPFILL